MHSRKQTIGRNMLRIFEIALFFAISVIGYGFMLKLSSSSAKSKNRDNNPIACQHSLDMNGLRRELNLLTSPLLFPREAAEASRHNELAVPQAIHSLQLLARHYRYDKSHAAHALNASLRLPRPCNLLEQNPLLLN